MQKSILMQNYMNICWLLYKRDKGRGSRKHTLQCSLSLCVATSFSTAQVEILSKRYSTESKVMRRKYAHFVLSSWLTHSREG